MVTFIYNFWFWYRGKNPKCLIKSLVPIITTTHFLHRIIQELVQNGVQTSITFELRVPPYQFSLRPALYQSRHLVRQHWLLGKYHNCYNIIFYEKKPKKNESEFVHTIKTLIILHNYRPLPNNPVSTTVSLVQSL